MKRNEEKAYAAYCLGEMKHELLWGLQECFTSLAAAAWLNIRNLHFIRFSEKNWQHALEAQRAQAAEAGATLGLAGRRR